MLRSTTTILKVPVRHASSGHPSLPTDYVFHYVNILVTISHVSHHIREGPRVFINRCLLEFNNVLGQLSVLFFPTYSYRFILKHRSFYLSLLKKKKKKKKLLFPKLVEPLVLVQFNLPRPRNLSLKTQPCLITGQEKKGKLIGLVS